MPGPCPVPTAIKRMRSKATGNPPTDAQQRARPRCPEYLDDIAKREWKRWVPMLLKIKGLITDVDALALGNLCQAYSTMQQAQTEMNRTGLLIKAKTGWVQQSPLVAIMQQQLKIVNGLCAEFGMTSSGRVRLQGVGKQTKEASGWDEFD